MQSLRCKIGWRAALIACTLIACFSTARSCSRNCFSDNANETDGSVGIQADSATEFGLSLLKKIGAHASNTPPFGNVHIGQVSVRAVFDLAYLGAREKTKEEISTAFVLGNVKQSKLLPIYRELVGGLRHNATQEENYTVNIVSRIYFDKNIKLRECMVEKIGSDIQQADFRAASEATRQTINRFVEEQTDKVIVDLIPEGGITSGTTMLLVNAISFKANWAKPFHPNNTRHRIFVGSGTQYEYVTMSQYMDVLYGTSSTLECTAVALPYAGERLEMLLLLPDRSDDAQTILKRVTKENLKELRGNMTIKNTLVQLPRVNMTLSYDLTGELKSLGVKDAFEASLADFSGFTGSKNAFIPSVYHKTYIAFTESGTEEDAPVGAEIISKPSGNNTKSFAPNIPYVFILRDKKYDYPLSMGLIMDPQL